MPKIMALVADFCTNIIDAKISAGGLSFLKSTTGIVLFYAGPTADIIKLVQIKRKDPSFSPDPNWKLAANEATRLGANRIDDTGLFSYLMSKNFLADLIKAAGRTAARRMSKPVWDYVSKKFSQTASFREASTLVCGADEGSSFRAEELLGLLDNPKIEIVNKHSADLFRDFRVLGANEVFRLACMTKLLELRAHAKASNDNDAKALYKNQRDYFLAWREGEKATFKAKPKSTRLAFKAARQEILSRHHAKTASPVAPTKSVPPSVPKPTKTP